MHLAALDRAQYLDPIAFLNGGGAPSMAVDDLAVASGRNSSPIRGMAHELDEIGDRDILGDISFAAVDDDVHAANRKGENDSMRDGVTPVKRRSTRASAVTGASRMPLR